jgi:hypothetical protein
MAFALDFDSACLRLGLDFENQQHEARDQKKSGGWTRKFGVA